MKYIEKKYQALIEDIKSVYDDAMSAYDYEIGTLKDHINELKKILAEKDEMIEKLKGGDQLQKEIDEYNRLEAQKNMNLEDDLVQLKTENTELKSKLEQVVVHHCGDSESKVYRPKKSGRGVYERKPFIISCGDCGILFEAKGGNAKYCPECRKARICARSKAWKKKNKSNK